MGEGGVFGVLTKKVWWVSGMLPGRRGGSTTTTTTTVQGSHGAVVVNSIGNGGDASASTATGGSMATLILHVTVTCTSVIGSTRVVMELSVG